MKKKIFMAAAVLFNSTLHAQDSTKVLDELVITANKFPVKTSLTGKVVTVITRDQLEKSGGKDLSQVLTAQAGLFINGANSNPAKDKSLYLRGTKVDHTLIMVDGVPLYDPSGIGSNFDIRLIPIDEIERIEILKGSQSTLYGSDAIAGVINIITRKAVNKPLGFSGMLSYGSYNTVHANTAASGSRGKFNYRVDYTYYCTDGINEATDTITRPHITGRNGYTQNSLYASLGFRPCSSVIVEPYLRFTKHHANLDLGAFTDDLDYTADTKNTQAGIKNEIHLGKAILHLVYNYNDIQRIYLDDSARIRDASDQYSRSVYTGREHFADAYGIFPLGQTIKLTAGVDFRSSNSDQEYHSISIYGPYNSQLGKDSLHHNQLGLYTALVLDTRSGFNAELGGRINHHSAYGNNAVYNFNPSFLFQKKWKAFINISSAFKTPTLYQLYSDYGNVKLKPESAFTLEGGLQYYSNNNSFSGRVTYFNRSVKDVIVFFTDPISYSSNYINQDKQDDHGLELETSVQLCPTTLLKVYYTWVDGKVTTSLAGKDTAYFNLIRRPKSSFGMSLGSKLSPKLYISMDMSAVGKRTDISYDAYFNPVQIDLKAYVLCNFYAEYAFLKNKLKCFTGLRNITNTRYTEVYGFNTTGFNASVGCRFNF